MGILIYSAETKEVECDFCGTKFRDAASMFSCDDCGKFICEDCYVEPGDPDCPNDFCEICIEK